MEDWEEGGGEEGEVAERKRAAAGAAATLATPSLTNRNAAISPRQQRHRTQQTQQHTQSPGTLLIPQEPFELLVRRAITRLLAPSLQVMTTR